MANAPGIGVALNGVLLIGALSALAYLYSRGSGRGDVGEERLEEWYEGAESLAREVARTATAERPVDPDRITRQLLPLSSRIEGHARGAPEAVGAESIERLYHLASRCRRIGMGRFTRPKIQAETFLEDELDDLAASAREAEAGLRP